MTTFVDTNVLIAITDPDHTHYAWCAETVVMRKLEGPMIVSDIVYSEFSMGMETIEKVDTVIAGLGFERSSLSNDALFRAGRAFLKYKRGTDGTKTNVLPDFLVGAAAAVLNEPLMTCNPKDFTDYFDELELVQP